MNPAADGIFSKNVAESDLISERGIGRGFVVDAFDPGRKHPRLEIAGARQQQDIAGMPINRKNRGLVLFDLPAHPPVIVLVKIAHSNAFR